MAKRRVAEADYVGRLRFMQRENAADKCCANCGDRGPTYVCMDFLTFVCTVCSGIHREFGHKVRGISISKWSIDEVIQIERNGGNKKDREKYLALWTPEEMPEPIVEAVADIRKLIKLKYVEKKWVKDDETPSSSKEKTKKKSEAPTKKTLAQLAKKAEINDASESEEESSASPPPRRVTKRSSERSTRRNKPDRNEFLSGDASPYAEGNFQNNFSPMNAAVNSPSMSQQMAYPQTVESGSFFGYPEAQPLPSPFGNTAMNSMYSIPSVPAYSTLPSMFPSNPQLPPFAKHPTSALPSYTPHTTSPPSYTHPAALLPSYAPLPSMSPQMFASLQSPQHGLATTALGPLYPYHPHLTSFPPAAGRNPFGESQRLKSPLFKHPGLDPRVRPLHMQMPLQPTMEMTFSHPLNPFAN